MMETNGSETAESQGTVTPEPSVAEKTGSHGAIRYLAVLVATVALIIVALYFLGGGGAGTPTTTTVLPSMTTTPAVTTVTSITFAPVVANFTRSFTTVISGTSPLSQGAAHGYLFTYYGQNANQTLTIRTLTYANVSRMMSRYNLLAAGIQNGTIAFNGLPANATGGKVKQSQSGTSLYSITAYSGNTLITTSLISLSSSDVGQNVSAAILIGALNSAEADLANLT